MTYVSPEEASKKFPVGTVIRMDQTRLDSWLADVGPKLKDRIGVVVAQLRQSSSLMLCFPAIGRRKEFRMVSNPDRLLLKVEDAAEIEAWRVEVAATAARAEKTRLAKMAKKAKASASP